MHTRWHPSLTLWALTNTPVRSFVPSIIMNIDQPEMDPLEAFLGQGSGEKTNEKLRLAIQQKTLGVLRRRRWLRRGSWLAGLAACYAAGILTMQIWPAPEVNHPVAIAPEQNDVSQVNVAPPPTETKPPTPAQPPESALEVAPVSEVWSR